METELLRDINPVPVEPNGMDMGRMAQFFNQDRTDEQAGFLQSFTTEFITDGATGIVYEVLARRAGMGNVGEDAIWDIATRVENGVTYLSISTPGTIRKSPALDDAVGIVDLGEEFQLAEGFLYLEFDADLTCTLKLGEIDSYPELWEIEPYEDVDGEPDLTSPWYRMVAYRHPLWKIFIADEDTATDYPDARIITTGNQDAALLRMSPPTHFQLYNTRYEDADGKIANVVQLHESYRSDQSVYFVAP